MRRAFSVPEICDLTSKIKDPTTKSLSPDELRFGVCPGQQIPRTQFCKKRANTERSFQWLSGQSGLLKRPVFTFFLEHQPSAANLFVTSSSIIACTKALRFTSSHNDSDEDNLHIQIIGRSPTGHLYLDAAFGEIHDVIQREVRVHLFH